MKKTTYLWLAALVIVTVAAIFTFTGNENVVPPEPVTADTTPVTNAAVEDRTDTVDIDRETVAEVREEIAEASTEDTALQDDVVKEEPAAGNATEKDIAQDTDPAPDVEQVLSDRTMGNPDAGIVIREFASLTCSHCAAFYNNTFPDLMDQYIDTGKVYFIYEDFPLNAPALEATLVARCLPQDKFFRFIKFLYKTQDEWAFDANYSDYLRQNARLLGLSEAEYRACAGNPALRAEFSEMMAQNQEQYGLRSTPTFIVEDVDTGKTEKITGAQPVDVFRTVIDKFAEGTDSTE